MNKGISKAAGARNPHDILVEDYGYKTVDNDPGALFTMERCLTESGRRGTHIVVNSKLRVGRIVDMQRDYCTISFYVNCRKAVYAEVECGFNRARQLGMRMVVAWHRISEKNRKGGDK